MSDLAPECEALAERLRAVRVRTGLSLAALAARTQYSKSSWERYLNGKKPAPRQAVEALCRLAGEPAGKMIALWELADAQWSGRGRNTRSEVPSETASVRIGHPDAAAPEIGSTGAADITDARDPAGRRWLFALGAGATALAAVVALVALLVRVPDTGRATDPAVSTPSPAPACQGMGCDGEDAEDTLCGVPGRVGTLLGPTAGTGAVVQIRYSTVCDTVWGRMWHTKVGDMLELSAPGRRPRHVVDKEKTNDYLSTRMIAVSDFSGLQVCFIPRGPAERQCFGP